MTTNRGVANLFFVSIASVATRATAATGGFPNVTLRTHDNRRVRFYDELIKGKVVLINFMFTTCTSQGPRATDKIAAVQRALGDRAGRDVFLISVTTDPETDTPAVLKRYAEQYQAGPGWTFVTGSRDDIELVERSMGVFERDRTQHTGMAIYGNDATGAWAATPLMHNAASIALAVQRLLAPDATPSPAPAPDRSSLLAAPAGSLPPGSPPPGSRRRRRIPPRPAG